MQTHVSKRMLPIHGLRLEWMKEELCREIYTKPIAEHWNICGSLLKYLDWDHSIPDKLFKMVLPTPTQTQKNCSELCLVSRQHWAKLCCVARREDKRAIAGTLTILPCTPCHGSSPSSRQSLWTTTTDSEKTNSQHFTGRNCGSNTGGHRPYNTTIQQLLKLYMIYIYIHIIE